MNIRNIMHNPLFFNIAEGSFYCCCKCKGLFNIQDDKLKHQVSCMGNPMETTCAYFACERKIFLQVYY